jgi:hypothetical protein
MSGSMSGQARKDRAPPVNLVEYPSRARLRLDVPAQRRHPERLTGTDDPSAHVADTVQTTVLGALVRRAGPTARRQSLSPNPNLDVQSRGTVW